ncbi:hypothetical protein PFISCL1PPCAC_14651, partial [Pristionchus fissidentatus]
RERERERGERRRKDRGGEHRNTHSITNDHMELSRPLFSPNCRPCLICGGPTKFCHLGVDSCRACSTFYRRTKEKSGQLKCRNGLGRCVVDKDEKMMCKKCRFERFAQILEGNEEHNHTSNIVYNCDEPSSIPQDPHLNKIAPFQLVDNKNERIPSVSSPFLSLPADSSLNAQKIEERLEDSVIVSNERRIMNRIRQSYSLLCLVRRTSELTSRSTPVNPLQAANGDIPYLPATIASKNQTTRILVTALFDFASSAFDEFGSLESNEKWLLITNYTKMFSCIESFYRVPQVFPDRVDICMASYTTYFDFANIDQFLFEHFPQEKAESARNALDKSIFDDWRIFQDTMRRIDPNEEEFLALLGLSFWNIDSIAAGENLTSIAERNRKGILYELHVLYKEEEKRNEYAGRLGELLFLIMTFQSCIARMPERLEYFRLLDLIDDDHVLYSMQRAQ